MDAALALEAAHLVAERRATPQAIATLVADLGIDADPFPDGGRETALARWRDGLGEPRLRLPDLDPWPTAIDVPAPPDEADLGGGDGRLVVIAGYLPVADDLRELAITAGWDVAEEATDEVPFLIVDCGTDPEDAPLQGAQQAILLAEGALHALDPSGTACGFHAIPPVGTVVEVTARADRHATSFEAFVRTLGAEPVRVHDGPGLVQGRIWAQLVNHLVFAGQTEHELLQRAEEAAVAHVLLLLDALHDHHRDPRFRAAPLLRELVDEGRGFHES